MRKSKEHDKKHKACFSHFVGYSYGKYVSIIGLKAPGNYSDQLRSNKISVLLWKGPKPPNSMIYGFLDPGAPSFRDLNIPNLL